MTELKTRSILDARLNSLSEKITQLSSLVDEAIVNAMDSLYKRDAILALSVIEGDQQVNELRYSIEEEALHILATQQPMATDLRRVIAAIHIAVELERIGDHASGIAVLVERMESEDEIDSLHKLPKMAKRARSMVQIGTEAYAKNDEALAFTLIAQDDKLDRQYRKLFGETIEEMRDDDYIRRATYLLWVGHDLERIGDRATNIAERVIFMNTGKHIEVSYIPD
ncbi:MAG: phosphate signaling complex protein PhoU [Candidatus Promineifilaceae bacterium]|nr:phosphate signaling complex protein PhoU [Candidatus Promineifilaceae bacterium]